MTPFTEEILTQVRAMEFSVKFLPRENDIRMEIKRED